MHGRHLYPKIDVHYLRTFLGLAGLCFFALTALVVVSDVFHRTDDFIEYAEATGKGMATILHLIGRYYAAFAPGMVLQYMMPLAILLGAVMTVSFSMMHNEYVALRAAGVSMSRLIVPLLVSALAVGVANELARDHVLPRLLRATHNIAMTVKPRSARPIGLVLRDEGRLHSVSLGHFDSATGKAYNLRVEVRDLESLGRGATAFEVYRAHEAMLAPRVDMAEVPEEDLRQWRWTPAAGPVHEVHTPYGWRKEAWVEGRPTLVTPALLERQVLGEAVMTWDDLARLADEDMDVLLERWRRISEPAACLALVLFALPLILRRSLLGKEPSYIVNVVLGVFACAVFYIVRLGFLSMGESQTLPPVLAAWAPALLFAAAGAWMLVRMERR